MERLIPGLLMAVLWVLLLFLAPPLIFWLVITLGAATALTEFFRMTGKVPHSTSLLILSVVVCLIPILTAATGSAPAVLSGSYLALLALVLVVIFLYTRFANPLAFLLHAGFSVFYISLCSAFIVLLRSFPDGSFWLLLLTAITAGSDTGAYYVGRTFGKRKLCPEISPGKTVNGALGGVLAAVLLVIFIGLYLRPEISSVKLALATALLALVGIAGDLAESIIKRGTGIKDSGSLLGGHGGLLDRIDSLLLAAPLLYLLLYFGMLG
ncbi:MAG: phosphatidate cytidylyltransferase [Candidatus Electrothrix sp. AR3]|nr:phosphatidate cytidylyltransferase [Candidatus Electrothrix sp. AR3]